MPRTYESLTNSNATSAADRSFAETAQGVHAHGGRMGIERRLDELNHEWDVHRVSAAIAGAAILSGFLLSEALSRKALMAPILAGGFLVAQAALGKSPLEPLLQGYGFRTTAEIAEERVALKSLRGDFGNLARLTTEADRADVSRFEDEGGRSVSEEEETAHDQNDRYAFCQAMHAAGH
jgi:hypothetical protein